MSFYSDIQADAVALLTEFGQDASVTRSGVVVGKAKTVQVGRKKAEITASSLPGVSYTAGDERSFLMAPGKVTPQMNDVLTWGKVVGTIKEVEEVSPGGTSLLWKVLVQ